MISRERVRWWIMLKAYPVGIWLGHPLRRIALRIQRRRWRTLRFAVGDSHAAFTFAGIPGVVRLPAGAVTMHRVGRDGLGGFRLFRDGPTLWPRRLLRPGDAVYFCFGEIDCRRHVAGQIRAGRDEESVIMELAERYIRAIVAVRREGVSFRIASVTPPAYERLADFRNFPSTGSDADRARYTRRLNDALRAIAARHGIGYLDVYGRYADERGKLPLALSDGTAHIGKTDRIRALLAETSGGT